MRDTNETQWWKKYVPEIKQRKRYEAQWKDVENASWEIDPNSVENNQGLYDTLVAGYFDFSVAPESVLNDVLKITGNVDGGSRQGEFHRGLLVLQIARNPNALKCDFELLKRTALKVRGEGLEKIVLTHKDCTEKDLIEVAKTNAELSWKTVDRSKEGWGFQPIVGELTMWGKIFMDPQASDELKQAIVEHGLDVTDNSYYDIEDRIRNREKGIKEEPTVLDYFLKRDDCPKEFFVPAVQDCMGSYFHKYTRETDYVVDAERLKEIVAHPKMTGEAFEEALYIVREDMVEYAEDPEETQGYYRGKDDTCDLTYEDKQQILQTMLKNPACTSEIAVDIFVAADKAYLLKEVREFAQKEKLFPEAEKQIEERLAEVARQEEINNALARVHKKNEDPLTAKKPGDVALNKAVLKAKFNRGR